MAFSVEYIFKMTEVEKHAVTVVFNPMSHIASLYPWGITVVHVKSLDLETYLKHIMTSFEHCGSVVVECMDASKSESESFELEIDTSDIYEIEMIG